MFLEVDVYNSTAPFVGDIIESHKRTSLPNARIDPYISQTYRRIFSYSTQLGIIEDYMCFIGAWGSVVVQALRYDSGSPGIDSRWCHWIFQ